VKTYCEHCNRETSYSAVERNASREAIDVACFRGAEIIRMYVNECDTFTAGRRAGPKEALRLVTDNTIGPRDLPGRIRKAMKPARVK
jgi:hypothetical protein